MVNLQPGQLRALLRLAHFCDVAWLLKPLEAQLTRHCATGKLSLEQLLDAVQLAEELGLQCLRQSADAAASAKATKERTQGELVHLVRLAEERGLLLLQSCAVCAIASKVLGVAASGPDGGCVYDACQ